MRHFFPFRDPSIGKPHTWRPLVEKNASYIMYIQILFKGVF